MCAIPFDFSHHKKDQICKNSLVHEDNEKEMIRRNQKQESQLKAR